MKKNINLDLSKMLVLIFNICFILATIFLPGIIKAQSSAPPTRTPGSPVGSYKLSDFDTVNLFGGNLNFNLSLLNVGGRGDVSQSLSLTLQTQWGSQRTDHPLGNINYEISPTTTNPLSFVGYLTAQGDDSRTDYQEPCSDNGDSPSLYRIHHQFNFIYVEADGTEHRLVDQYYRGLPFTTCGQPNIGYGRIFESTDGEFMSFIADANVFTYGFTLNGYLFFKNGIHSRVEGGKILWSKDRNGNKIEYTYHPNYNLPFYIPKPTKIKDSIGREISIEYNVNEPAPYGLSDRVFYKGTGGQERIIRISKDSLQNTLRTSQSSDSGTVKTIGELFPEYPAGNVTVSNATTQFNPETVKAIWLPDGRSYRFKYSVYGRLARVELPTGGSTEYDFEPSDSTIGSYDGVLNRVKEKRIYKENNSLETKTTFARSIPLTSDYPDAAGGGTAVTVEQFDSNNHRLSKSRHLFYSQAGGIYEYWGWKNGKEFKTETFDSDGTTLLRKVEMNWKQRIPSWCYNNPYIGVPCGNNPAELAPLSNAFIVETKETLADGNLVKLTSSVNPANGSWAVDSFNNITDVWEYDYGIGQPGQFLRRTHADYITGTNYTYYGNSYLPGLTTQTWISADVGGNNKASLTRFEYDNYAGGNNAALVSRSNVFGHDTNNYGITNTSRGNVTKITSFGNARNQTEAVNTYSNYDILGNVVKTYDAKGYISTIDYSDRFGAPDGEARSNSAPSYLDPQNITRYPLNGQSAFAFPTSATNPLSYTVYTQFDYFTGQAVNSEDINGVINKEIYNDLLDRLTQTVTAVGTALEMQSNIVYDDANRRVEFRSDLNNLNDNLLKSESFYDGLGRTIENRKYEADGGYIATKLIPFAMVQDPETSIWRGGKKSSNPYRPNAGEQPIWTTGLSDSLGRSIRVITPDGAVVKTEYSGNTVTVTDQAGKKRRSLTNALGQLIRVDEPDGSGNLGSVESPNQPTSYIYNKLGKMIEVTQGVQKRYFLYDSLGRLLRVRQPEQQVNPALNLSGSESVNTQWTAAFSYDKNGNMLTATDAGNATITNNYDALNRAVMRSYSDLVTPTVTFTYDDAAVPNSKGKLTKISCSISEMRYNSYDKMGRLLSSEQSTDGQTYSSSYKYNLAGLPTEQTYPSGRVVKEFLANDGNLAAISSKVWNGQYRMYAANFGYTATGVIKHLQIGNGLWESAKLNSRQQVTELNLGTSPTDGSKWQLKYDYGELDANGIVDATRNSGNIAKQTITFSGLTQPFVQTYKYDSLDRISEAKETNSGNQTWKQSWSYDRYGNRTGFTQQFGSQQLPINNLTLPQIDANTNRFQTGQGYNYDADGNVIQDAEGRQFTFDGENKQTEVRDASNNVVGRYYYDGNGKRVKKVTNSETIIFVYDGMGKLAAEYSTASPLQNPTTNYTATDPLGSPRVITNKLGEIISRRDFMPFGEQLAPDPTYRTASLKYNNADNIRQKFTSYQRDEETQLDFAEARYYYNNHGRFTAVDPLLASGKSANPQTFNRYIYTMNRPLILTDSTGLQAGQNSETQLKLIPLPKKLLDLASLDRRTTTTGEVYKLTPNEIKQRVELATLAYNEGFKRGERDAQEHLGEKIDVNSIESVNSSGDEKSKEKSNEVGLTVSPKDVDVSLKETGKVGQKDTNNGSFKAGADVDSGVPESVSETKNIAKAMQVVINEQNSVVRDVIDNDNNSVKGTVDVTAGVNEMVKHSRILGKVDGFIGYMKSH